MENETTAPETTTDQAGRAMSDLLYVLAGRRDQAEKFAVERGFTYSKLRYICQDYSLRGIDGKGKTLFICGTGAQRKNYREIVDMAAMRGWNIEHV